MLARMRKLGWRRRSLLFVTDPSPPCNLLCCPILASPSPALVSISVPWSSLIAVMLQMR